MAKDDGGVFLEDAIEAFFTAGQKKDWPAAASALRDALDVVGMAEGPEEEEPPHDKGKGRPIASIILGLGKKA